MLRLGYLPGAEVDFACPAGKPWLDEAALTDWTPDMPSRGVGDTIAKATSALGIKPCAGCKKRQAWLNRHFPYAQANEL